MVFMSSLILGGVDDDVESRIVTGWSNSMLRYTLSPGYRVEVEEVVVVDVFSSSTLTIRGTDVTMAVCVLMLVKGREGLTGR